MGGEVWKWKKSASKGIMFPLRNEENARKRSCTCRAIDSSSSRTAHQTLWLLPAFSIYTLYCCLISKINLTLPLPHQFVFRISFYMKDNLCRFSLIILSHFISNGYFFQRMLFVLSFSSMQKIS